MDTLEKAVADGTAVLVIGSGFSAATSRGKGTATWLGLIKAGADRAQKVDPKRDEQWRDLVDATLNYGIDNGDPDSLIRAASMVSGALKATSPQTFADWLREDVGNLPVEDSSLADAIQAMHLAILTTNYDELLESSLRRPSAVWTEPAQMQQLLLGHSNAIGHLHGVWNSPASVVFSEADYSNLLHSPAAQAIQQAVSAIKSLVYIGFGGGLDDPNFSRLLLWHREVFPVSGVEHFRLCRESELFELNQVHAGDSVTPVAYGAEHSDLPAFLTKIAPAKDALQLSASGIARDTASEAQSAMAESLVADSVIAETMHEMVIEVERALLLPVLLPVPNAEYVRARSQGDKSTHFERIDPIQEAREAEYIIIVGDDESGVTTTIKWMALAAAQHLGNVAPIYVNFRDCRKPTNPLDDRLRAAARELGLPTGRDEGMPPYVLALDDVNAKVPKLSERVLEAVVSCDAFSVVIGCKSGQEDEISEHLKALGVRPRVRYLGRLGFDDVTVLARAVSPSNFKPLAEHVMTVLRSENLPRTPLSVSLLLSILFQGGRVASTASQTAILDQYVSSLLGRGNPHEDARYEVDQQGREALLAGLAQVYVERVASGLSESEVVAALEEILGRLGWTESPTRILRGLIERRVVRRAGGLIVFSRNSYLYLFAAKRAGSSRDFLNAILERPLYFASIIKAHAALVRQDQELLTRVRPLVLYRQEMANLNSPFEAIGPVEPPEISNVAREIGSPATGGTEKRHELVSDRMDDIASGEETRPAFPADDPMQMPFAMRLLRALDLVSTILRDSDQIEDLPLKRSVLAEVLDGWGVAVGALTEDAEFQEYVRMLAEDVSAVLVGQNLESDERARLLDDFARMFPAAMSLGGISTTLSSRKLIAAYDGLYEDGLLDGTNEVSLGAVAFAYSLRAPGWPAKVLRLMRDRANQWIGRNFFFYLFYEEYVHDRCEVGDRDVLLELCVHLTIAPFRFGSEADRVTYADRVRARYRADGLSARAREKEVVLPMAQRRSPDANGPVI